MTMLKQHQGKCPISGGGLGQYPPVSMRARLEVTVVYTYIVRAGNEESSSRVGRKESASASSGGESPRHTP